MASIALFAAGAALAGPLTGFAGTALIFGGLTVAAAGGAAGGLIGSFIDSQFVFPAIFGRGSESSIVGPRLGDFQIQSGSEGTPIRFVVGPQNRIAGNVIDLSDLHERAVVESGGGGKGGQSGGGGGSATTYYYNVDVVIGVCEGPIESITRIWADSKVIYENGNTTPRLSYTASATPTFTTRAPKGYFTFYGPDVFLAEVSTAIKGQKIVTTGYTLAANNGTFTVDHVEDGGAGIVLIYVKEPLVSEAAGLDAVTFQLLPYKDARYKDLRIYLGTTGQSVDPFLEAWHGVGKTPAYRGIAYVVIEALELRDFGNRLPSMSFLINERSDCSVGDAVQKICSRISDITLPIVTTEVRGTLLGYSIADGMSLIQMLEPLMLAFNLNAIETAGTVYFYNRSREHLVQVDGNDLAAHVPGETTPRVVKFNDAPERDLPSDVNVLYLEPEQDYQQAAAKERRQDVAYRNFVQLSIPIVMSATQARAVAYRVLWSSWAERTNVSITLPPKYLNIEETDILQMTAEGESLNIRVTQLERGATWQTSINGVLIEPQTYRNIAAEDDPVAGATLPPYSAPIVIGYLMDIPPMRDADAMTVGFYYAVSPYDSSQEWNGGAGYVTTDGVSFALSFSAGTRATSGTTLAALNSSAPADNYWDRSSTLDVEMDYGQLTSSTEDQVAGGANRLYIGGEIIAFCTATLLSPGPTGKARYRLSKLLRGLRDTSDKITTHGSTEGVVLISDATAVGWKDLSSGSLGATRVYKVAGNGADITGVDPQSFATNGATLRQFRPCFLKGVRDGSSNLTISWTRRSRYLVRPMFSSYSPIGHTEERYEVDVYNGSTILRTLTPAAGQTSASYSAANQTTDFGGPIGSVKVRVYQIGPTGRGNYLEQFV